MPLPLPPVDPSKFQPVLVDDMPSDWKREPTADVFAREATRLQCPTDAVRYKVAIALPDTNVGVAYMNYTHALPSPDKYIFPVLVASETFIEMYGMSDFQRTHIRLAVFGLPEPVYTGIFYQEQR